MCTYNIIIEPIVQSLSGCRYTSPSTEVLVEDVEAKRPKIMKPDPSEEMQNGTRKTSIEAVELYQLLQKSPDKVRKTLCYMKFSV